MFYEHPTRSLDKATAPVQAFLAATQAQLHTPRPSLHFAPHTIRELRRPHGQLGQKTSGGTPRSVFQLLFHLIPRIARLGIAFKLYQSGGKISLDFRGNLNRLRHCSNTLPDQLHEINSLLDRERQYFRHRYIGHEKQITTIANRALTSKTSGAEGVRLGRPVKAGPANSLDDGDAARPRAPRHPDRIRDTRH